MLLLAFILSGKVKTITSKYDVMLRTVIWISTTLLLPESWLWWCVPRVFVLCCDAHHVCSTYQLGNITLSLLFLLLPSVAIVFILLFHIVALIITISCSFFVYYHFSLLISCHWTYYCSIKITLRFSFLLISKQDKNTIIDTMLLWFTAWYTHAFSTVVFLFFFFFFSSLLLGFTSEAWYIGFMVCL